MNIKRITDIRTMKNKSIILMSNKDLEDINFHTTSVINLVKINIKVTKDGVCGLIITNPFDTKEIAICDELLNNNFVYELLSEDKNNSLQNQENIELNDFTINELVLARRQNRKLESKIKRYEKMLSNNNINIDQAPAKPKKDTYIEYSSFKSSIPILNEGLGLTHDKVFVKLYRKGKTIKCVMHGLVANPNGYTEITAEGYAVCHNEDRFNLSVGENIACAKAVASLISKSA